MCSFHQPVLLPVFNNGGNIQVEDRTKVKGLAERGLTEGPGGDGGGAGYRM